MQLTAWNGAEHDDRAYETEFAFYVLQLEVTS